MSNNSYQPTEFLEVQIWFVNRATVASLTDQKFCIILSPQETIKFLQANKLVNKLTQTENDATGEATMTKQMTIVFNEPTTTEPEELLDVILAWVEAHDLTIFASIGEVEEAEDEQEK